MRKNVLLPVNNLINSSVSATVSVTSSETSIMYVDSVAFQSSWTGNPYGTFDIQGSIDYNPGNPQSHGKANSGTWTSIDFGTTLLVSSATSSLLVNMNQLAFSWLRVVYTNSTSSGSIQGWLCSKSLG